MFRLKMFWTAVCAVMMTIMPCVSLIAQTASKTIVAPRIRQARQALPVKSGVARTTSRTPLDVVIPSIRVKNAPISAFLDAISAQSKLNFITEEKLKTLKVTAFMKNVLVRDALQVLLRVHNLTYQQIGDSNVFVILSRQGKGIPLITKIYTLKYISLLRPMEVNEEFAAITSQDMGGTTMAAGRSDDISSSRSSSRSLVEGVRGAAEKGYEGGIAILNVINSVLSPDGKIAIEPRTNSVVITDIAEKFPQIEQIINELDIKSPQVLIEAEIVEVNNDYAKELGLKWGDPTGAFGSFQGPIREHTYFLRQGFFNDPSWANFFNPADIFSENGILSLKQFQILLSALITKGEARFLGKPKVVTLNNKTAIITSSRDAALSVSSETTELSSTQSVERSRVGLTLRVTPQVNIDGFITLLVQPSYSDVVLSTIETSTGVVFDPISRGVSTQVRVKNGETVIIGGLISSTKEKVIRRVPLLGYIPILGWLFTNVSNDTKNTDLVIMITPKIIND